LVGSAIAIKNASSVDSALGGLLFFFALFGGPGLIVFWALRSFQHTEYVNSARHMSHNDGSPLVLQGPPIKERVGDSLDYVKTRSFTREHDVDDNNEPPLSREQVESIRNAGALVEEDGISFFQCYGLVTSNENLPRLVDAIRISLPPSYYGSAAEWSDAIVENAHNRFLKEFSLSTNPINMERLLQIFPGKPDEETDEYMWRLLNALKKILGENAVDGVPEEWQAAFRSSPSNS
jgi:hypothetical protein